MDAIPDDILAAARHAFDEARAMSIYDTQVLIIARAIATERERCAKIAEKTRTYDAGEDMTRKEIAAAIRRGTA